MPDFSLNWSIGELVLKDRALLALESAALRRQLAVGAVLASTAGLTGRIAALLRRMMQS